MEPSSDRADVHPVLACVGTMVLALAEVSATEVAYMTPVDRRSALLELVQVEARAVSLRLRLLLASDDLAQDEGARDVAALVTHHARTDAAPTAVTWGSPGPWSGGGRWARGWRRDRSTWLRPG